MKKIPPSEYEIDPGSGKLGRALRRVQRELRWRWKGRISAPRTVLVDVRWRLGDEIMTLPVVEALRRQFPKTKVAVWTHYPELFIDNRFVDSVNDRFVEADRYIDLRSGPRTENRLAHYARLAGVDAPNRPPKLRYHSWEAPVAEMRRFPPGKTVAVSTGATWATKRWPLWRWQELVEELQSEGMTVVQLGRDDEQLEGVVNLMNQTGIRDAACILKRCSVFVGCDSGLMHLALAAGTPVVALFGPTVPSILVQPRRTLKIVTNNRDCQGCWNTLPEETEAGVCPRGYAECLGTISVNTVRAAIGELVDREGK